MSGVRVLSVLICSYHLISLATLMFLSAISETTTVPKSLCHVGHRLALGQVVSPRRKMAEVDVRFEMCVAMIWVPLRLWLISFLSTAAAFQLRPCPGMHIAHDRNHGRCQLRETKTKPTQKVFWGRRQNGPKLRVKCSEWFWKRHRSP